VKDNLNIEKLFKDKFENFEGNENPELWANISKGVASNTAVSSSIGLGVKALIVGMSAIAVGVTVYYVGDFNKSENQIVENIEETSETRVNTELENETVLPLTVIIAEDNDPVIAENKAEIIKELSNSDLENSVNAVSENSDVVNSNPVVADQTISESEVSVVVIEDQEKIDNSTEETVSVLDAQDQVELVQDQLMPTGEINAVATESIFKFEFNANAHNFDKITWRFGDGHVSLEENPTHIFNNVGTYVVELLIESENGKVYTETKRIEINTTTAIDNIANVITPNGDRINDEFIVNAVNVDEFSITITNQLGKTIFKSNDQNFIWDGTDFSGNSVKKTVYNYYIIAKGNDGAILKIPGQLYVR